MEFWAIRFRPTGEFMPARLDRTTRGGWSYWDPASRSTAAAGAPRLFSSERAAKAARTRWLQGEWRPVYAREGDWESGYHTERVGAAPHIPEHPRKTEDVEIVQIHLEVRA